MDMFTLLRGKIKSIALLAAVLVVVCAAAAGIYYSRLPAKVPSLLAGAVQYKGPYPEPGLVTYNTRGSSGGSKYLRQPPGTKTVHAFPGLILVTFKAGTTDKEAVKILTASGGKVLSTLPFLGRYMVDCGAGNEAAYISAMEASPKVSLAMPNMVTGAPGGRSRRSAPEDHL